MSGDPCFTFHEITASRTTPTLWVLVIMTGPLRNPESSTHVVPVISPLPLSVNQAANTASLLFFPRGWIAVTPVRTGPFPTSSLPCPEIKVVCPTSTPFTSVMALFAPGVPSKGTPRSRARGLLCAGRIVERKTSVQINATLRTGKWNIRPPGQSRQYKGNRRIKGLPQNPSVHWLKIPQVAAEYNHKQE